ncbi:MBL fold metallo-hydrolase [Aurantimonas sp. VKM B-3413]|uniref:MBL fold metallo-hydrolase n=1 Tax=Aurantimonas sp. VKM B-3413 TaxID=2779401 RepID=UPI001E2C80EA|nr:MBL fold metallo-hydrolase [Aurantimonas sp. VKM B-3413]MCB8839259.1 MBL fold metallo-hydrolase [Aurantimonas sp. VKM B-3413]
MDTTDAFPSLGSSLRMHRPAPGIVAFYDGRMAGRRAYSAEPNWLDDGAYELGVATYAIVSGEAALVYDTHISPAHAAIVRRTLEELGVSDITVVLSHWHRDHVAGNAVFADRPILAQEETIAALTRERNTIEDGNPPIRPLVMPTRTVSDREVLTIGETAVEIRLVDIHSRDGTLLHLPDEGLLLAGDALEDPITYVAEPDRLEAHLADLEKLAALAPKRILPNHGAEARIASGGFGPELIDATRRYVERLLACRCDRRLAALPLRAFIAEDFESGAVEYFPPYEAVHADNVRKVAGSS